MDAKYKLNEEVKILKGGGIVTVTIVERVSVTNLDNGESKIKYTYTVPNQTLAKVCEEDLFILYNQLAKQYEEIENN